MVIEDILGKPMNAFHVFVEAIRSIKKHSLDVLLDPTRMDNVNIKSEKEIHWILTVPAIWNDLSKRFMRDAAVKVLKDVYDK